MFTKWHVIYFCAYFLNELDAQYCQKTELIRRTVQVTYTISYITTYYGECNYNSCTKTRWVIAQRVRDVPKREWKIVKNCCSGYFRTDDSANDSDIVCEPICMPACKNGYCKAPGKCACNTGYVPHLVDTHNCLPSCKRDCEHGICVAPETCHCDFGYTFVNTTCQPVCTDPCHNGTCVAPETCECLSGYRKSEKNLCEPYCSNGCDHGFCAAPETCRCETGWHIEEGKDDQNKQCKPICSEPCHNGICVSPETCLCKGAYRKSENGTCEPVCSPSCGNGTCIAPQTCSCLPGYQAGVDNIYNVLDSPHLTGCKPICDHCKDAHCIAPNKCSPLSIISTKRKSRIPIDNLYNDIDISDYYNFESYYDSYSEPKDIASDDTETDLIKKNIHRSTQPDDTSTEITEYSYENPDDINKETVKHSDLGKTTESIKTLNNESTHSEDAPKQSLTWIERHWVSIFIPVLVILTAAIIMLLVWRWAPIIVFFKGRSYVVENEPVDTDVSRPFEDIQISAINEKERTAEK
ncbi:hypothetical protein PYW08_001835 [Mythimna loreyi]|uniref:Uncharacterized protein n=1 Tax=Mythimna loreyi TaxID=667449 RepID=A0ACC2R7S2_9NEOP|nr:hypothetical protein PYW08_001835 [Mythimna loreyi]